MMNNTNPKRSRGSASNRRGTPINVSSQEIAAQVVLSGRQESRKKSKHQRLFFLCRVQKMNALKCGLPTMTIALFLSAAGAMPPDSPRKPVVDLYHGVEVADDYRWLEDWNNPAVQKWSDAQNAHA